MALWKDQNASKKDDGANPQDATSNANAGAPRADEPRQPVRSRSAAESIIAAGLKIEGKIEGAGHVRIAGHFHGDVHVDGNLTIDSGAKLTGSVQAQTVIVGGELHGNIESANRVDLLETGILLGDLTAGALTVAAGSRMRGKAEFGWNDKEKDAQKSQQNRSPAAAAATSSSAATSAPASISKDGKAAP